MARPRLNCAAVAQATQNRVNTRNACAPTHIAVHIPRSRDGRLAGEAIATSEIGRETSAQLNLIELANYELIRRIHAGKCGERAEVHLR
jgi:hypothetical protein